MKRNTIDDYMSKYDSSVNPDNFADRWSFLGVLDVLGYQCKVGLIDLDILYELNWAPILMLWIKFKLIIMEYRKSVYSKDSYLILSS